MKVKDVLEILQETCAKNPEAEVYLTRWDDDGDETMTPLKRLIIVNTGWTQIKEVRFE